MDILIIDQEKVRNTIDYLKSSIPYVENAITDVKDAQRDLSDKPKLESRASDIAKSLECRLEDINGYITELEEAYTKSQKFNESEYDKNQLGENYLHTGSFSTEKPYFYKYTKKPTKDETKDPENPKKDPPKKLKAGKVNDFANAVIAGKYGSGAARIKALRKALKKAGYKGSDEQIVRIQRKVNSKLKGNTDPNTGADKKGNIKSAKEPKKDIRNANAKKANKIKTGQINKETGKKVTKASELKEKLNNQKAINKQMQKDNEAKIQELEKQTAYEKDKTQEAINSMEEQHKNEMANLDKNHTSEMNDLKDNFKDELTNIENKNQEKLDYLNDKIDKLEQDKADLINQNNNLQQAQNNNQASNNVSQPSHEFNAGVKEAVTPPTLEQPTPPVETPSSEIDTTIPEEIITEPEEIIEEEPIIIEPDPEIDTSNSSKGGSSVIPAILGVGAAGAAAVAGTRYIKNKNKSNDNYDDDDSYEDDYGDYDDNDNNDETYAYEAPKEGVETSEKYRAGSINKLVLDEQNDININDDYMEDEKEEELE